MKACLFDLDGVVFDTESLYTLFWRQICSESRPDIPGLETKIKGQTLVEVYDTYFSGDKALQDTITERLNNYEKEMEYSYVLGFEDFIKEVRNRGIKTAVVTSSNREKMEQVYEQHPEFKDMFDKILTSEDFEESKPSPDCYLKAAVCFDADPKECFVFEDSFNGLKSGKASGARVIGLSTTNSAAEIEPYCEVVISNYLDFTLPIS